MNTLSKIASAAIIVSTLAGTANAAEPVVKAMESWKSCILENTKANIKTYRQSVPDAMELAILGCTHLEAVATMLATEKFGLTGFTAITVKFQEGKTCYRKLANDGEAMCGPGW